MKIKYRPQIPAAISISVIVMTIIYICMGILLVCVFGNAPEGIPGNVLIALPKDSWANIVISLLMVITCIGSFPLYINPIQEVFRFNYGVLTTNRFFITNGKYILRNIVEIALVSFVGSLFTEFNKILQLDILFH